MDLARRFWVPGRIEVLGKHTDYAGGRSLLCAIERGFCVVAAPRSDRVLTIRDVRSGETSEAEITPGAEGPAGHWSAYPLIVARRLASNFGGPIAGADIAFESDLPRAAGISSSSALVVATFLALADVNALQERDEYRRSLSTPASLAEYLGAVENGLSYGELLGDRGVGTFGGSEDHTAILCARPGALAQYSFCPVRAERSIALDSNVAFVIASSGVVAEKTGSALAHYNRVASLAHAALARWRVATGRDDRSLGDAVRSVHGKHELLDGAMTARAGATNRDDFSDAAVVERARQFVIESEELIPAAGDALAAGRLDEFGAIVDRSMLNAVDMLHNQIDETVYLARRARELGAVAASAFGAGFGGSVWALVAATEADAYAARLLADYRRTFPARTAAEAFVTRASGGAARL